MLENIFAVLPTLKNLPRVKKWGTVYIPEWLMFEIYAFSGVDGMLKSLVVSKEWHDTLCDKKWDTLLWKTVYMRVVPEWERSRGDTPMASAVAPTPASSSAASEIPVASVLVPESEEKRSEGEITSTSWRKATAQWFQQKEIKRLTKIREQFRQEERNKLPSQGDRLVLLK